MSILAAACLHSVSDSNQFDAGDAHTDAGNEPGIEDQGVPDAGWLGDNADGGRPLSDAGGPPDAGIENGDSGFDDDSGIVLTDAGSSDAGGGPTVDAGATTTTAWSVQQALPFRVVDAVYSRTLDVLVLASENPNALRVVSTTRGTIATIPLLLLFAVSSKQLISGLTAGAVK